VERDDLNEPSGKSAKPSALKSWLTKLYTAAQKWLRSFASEPVALATLLLAFGTLWLSLETHNLATVARHDSLRNTTANIAQVDGTVEAAQQNVKNVDDLSIVIKNGGPSLAMHLKGWCLLVRSGDDSANIIPDHIDNPREGLIAAVRLTKDQGLPIRVASCANHDNLARANVRPDLLYVSSSWQSSTGEADDPTDSYPHFEHWFSLSGAGVRAEELLDSQLPSFNDAARALAATQLSRKPDEPAHLAKSELGNTSATAINVMSEPKISTATHHNQTKQLILRDRKST
jgi:hypothetical protein